MSGDDVIKVEDWHLTSNFIQEVERMFAEGAKFVAVMHLGVYIGTMYPAERE